MPRYEYAPQRVEANAMEPERVPETITLKRVAQLEDVTYFHDALLVDGGRSPRLITLVFLNPMLDAYLML